MNGLKQSKLNEQVEITCYNQTERMTRRQGLEKYYDCMKNSEGCEHERYETIFFQLLEGYKKASDEIPFYMF